ncbi:MAG: hypothetical protein WA813_20295, partial [Beijerinckiaceae bacterium]
MKTEKQFKVAVLVGSLRKGSFTRMVAKAMMRLAPPTPLSCEIGDSPPYNEDSDATARGLRLAISSTTRGELKLEATRSRST